MKWHCHALFLVVNVEWKWYNQVASQNSQRKTYSERQKIFVVHYIKWKKGKTYDIRQTY